MRIKYFWKGNVLQINLRSIVECITFIYLLINKYKYFRTVRITGFTDLSKLAVHIFYLNKVKGFINFIIVFTTHNQKEACFYYIGFYLLLATSIAWNSYFGKNFYFLV